MVTAGLRSLYPICHARSDADDEAAGNFELKADVPQGTRQGRFGALDAHECIRRRSGPGG